MNYNNDETALRVRTTRLPLELRYATYVFIQPNPARTTGVKSTWPADVSTQPLKLNDKPDGAS